MAVMLPRTSTWGAGLVADVEGSYLLQTNTAGLRVYRRTGLLFNQHRTVTYFAQILAGQATGSASGVLRSEGGRVIEPGVGLDYGSGRRTFHLQVGYRRVVEGVVYDSRLPGEPVDRLSKTRVVVGMTLRFLPR